MITNSSSTTMAPEYTMICSAAATGLASSRNSPATPMKLSTRHSPATTRLRWNTSATAPARVMRAKIRNMAIP